MKRKILSIFIALVLFIPIITKASSIEDLELKWTAEIEGDGYVFNPYTELDPNYAEYHHGNNESKFIETEEGYLIIGNSSFNLYDRKKGLVKSVDNGYSHKYIEDGDNYIILAKQNGKNVIKIINKKIEVLKEYEFPLSSTLDFFIKENALVVVYLQYDNGYYLESLALNKENLTKEASSKIFTGDYARYEKEGVYCDPNYNCYYLDENFNIKPDNLNNDNTYDILRISALYKYNSSGELIKTVSLKSSDGYNIGGNSVKKYNGYYYILNKEYKASSSTTNTYLHRASYYKYDTDLNLIDSKTLTAASTTSSYSYNANLYLNENGLFTYYSYNNQYYKIEDDFSFTTSTSSYAYNETDESADEKPENNNQLLAYKFADSYLYDIASQRKKELREEYDNAYVSFSYDSYYDETNNQVAIVVTWLEEIYVGGSNEFYIKSELMYVNEENYDSPEIITLFENHKYEGLNYINRDAIGAKMYVDDNNIIIALGLGDRITTSIYDKKGNIIKKLSEENVSELIPTMVKYEKGDLLIIFSRMMEDAKPNSDSRESTLTGEKENLPEATIIASLPGEYEKASYSYIEYYEMPFDITTKNDGNGTVKATKVKAESGEEIKFTITPKEGYVLGVIKITDSNGNIVAFTDYTFTMPSADVTIEATFVPENPDTSDKLIILSLVLVISGIFIIIKVNKNLKFIKN